MDVYNSQQSRSSLGTVMNEASTADDSLMCHGHDDEAPYDPALDVIIPTDEDEVAEEEEKEGEDDVWSDSEHNGGRSVDDFEVDYNYYDYNDDNDDDDGVYDKDDSDEPEIETEIM